MRKNFFDRAIEFVSPGRALQRLKARAVLDVANRQYDKMVEAQKRKYDAASKGRHYGDWHPGSLSPNQEVLRDLHILRERSRYLTRNNAYARNALRTLCNNVVGAGIIPTPKSIKIGKKQLDALKNAWTALAGKTACDFDDMNTFSGLQDLAFKVVIESGECIARRVRGTSKDAFPLRIQLLEGDYIDGNHHTGTWDGDGTMTYYGIKISKTGKRLGYWLYKQHPSEFSAESEFVSADDIVHLYEVERPGQIRGIPLSCGVMLRLRDLEDYELTERIRNKIAASFTVFITDNNTENSGDTDADELERIEPGMVKY
ncbi:MAG TPA: phage portal protein, partial [Niastella sp.]